MAPLEVESWTWYGFATTIFLARILSRILTRGEVTRHSKKSTDFWHGIKNLQVADFLMVLAFCFYTSEVVTMNITAKLQSNLLPPGYLEHHVMLPQEIAARHFGSVMTVVVEQCQISTIWLIKMCVLLMWASITNLAYKWRHRLVVAIGCYVVFTWVFMETFYFGVWCRPFTNYFAVPTPNPKQCAAAWDHLIMNAVFNLTSDLMLLAVTVSIAFERSLSAFTASSTRSVAFIGLCSLGVFVILCAVLNKAYSWENPYGSEWTFWYIRECSTAMILSNVPYAWQLYKLAQRIRDTDTDTHAGTSANATNSTAISTTRRQHEPWDRGMDKDKDVEFGGGNGLSRLTSPSEVYKKSPDVDDYSVPSSTETSPTASVKRSQFDGTESREHILGRDSRYRIVSAQEAEALGEDDNWLVTHANRRRLMSVCSKRGTAETVEAKDGYDESRCGRMSPVAPARLPTEKGWPLRREEAGVEQVEMKGKAKVMDWETGPAFEDVGGLVGGAGRK